MNNELFDAFPIMKFVYTKGEWCEVLVDNDNEDDKEKDDQELDLNTSNYTGRLNTDVALLHNNTSTNSNGNSEEEITQYNFKYTTSVPNNNNVRNILEPDKAFEGIKLNEWDTYEFAPEQIRFMFLLSYLLSSSKKSAGLIIDYGEEHGFSNSLRGIKEQKLYKDSDILKHTGECDLSAYVNFRALKNAVSHFKGLRVGGVMMQGDFLELMGIRDRLSFLQDNTTDPKMREMLNKQCQRLVDSTQMGDNFKVMYIHKANNNATYPFLFDILVNMDKAKN